MPAAILISGATVLAATVLGLAARRATAAAQTKHPPIGDFVTIGKTRVHYVKKGTGPVVIALHGAGGNLRDFTFSLLDQLAETHTVIAFDRPGHGYTDTLHNGGETPTEQANLLRAAARKLGVNYATLLGYSYGGAVSLAWALDDPDMITGMVLVASVIHPWPGGVASFYWRGGGVILGAIYRPVAALATDRQLRKSVSSVFEPQLPPDGYLDYVGKGLAVRPHTMRANGRQVTKLKSQVELLEKRYKNLKMPIEVLHGTADKSVFASIHAEPFAQTHSNANLTLIEGLGHGILQLEIPQILAATRRISPPAA